MFRGSVGKTKFHFSSQGQVNREPEIDGRCRLTWKLSKFQYSQASAATPCAKKNARQHRSGMDRARARVQQAGLDRHAPIQAVERRTASERYGTAWYPDRSSLTFNCLQSCIGRARVTDRS